MRASGPNQVIPARDEGLREREMVDGQVKGIPADSPPFPLDEISLRGWNVLRGDLPLPLAVLRASALDRNSAWMRAFLLSSGAVLAPHGKTTMSPRLFRRQLEDGAWGITVATVHQLRICREHGIDRVILANQLLGPGSIRYVLSELERAPEFDFYCFVDSPEGVKALEEAVQSSPIARPLQVLLEVGFDGGRAGSRRLAHAERVARMISESPGLVLRGVAGFEGLMNGSSPAEIEDGVSRFLDSLCELAESCDRADRFGPGPVILSAGGSAFYDMVARRFAAVSLTREVLTVIRSGCYLTHDSRMYEDQVPHLLGRSPELAALGMAPRAALELWSYVQSRPEPGRVILTVGKRDCSYDAGLPLALRWFRRGEHARPRPLPDGHRIVDLNDQHGFLDVPADSPLRFGDMVMLGISHPCTTFDKWQFLPVVDDEYDVVGGVRTYF